MYCHHDMMPAASCEQFGPKKVETALFVLGTLKNPWQLKIEEIIFD